MSLEISARSKGLTACHACGRTAALSEERCLRCGAKVEDYAAHGTQVVWAYLIAGIIAYIPANLYPMLITQALGHRSASTIVGGVFDLLAHGSYFVAIVVFVASVIIPIAKFIAVGYLAYSMNRPVRRRAREKRTLHLLVEAVGRWSMIDVFVVAVLAALVQLGLLATIEPGPAAGPFAISVILTMLAAHHLDSRAIWYPGPPSHHHSHNPGGRLAD